MSVIAVVAFVAAKQYALVHREQARALGVSEHALARAVASGELARRLPEVFAIAGAPRTWRQALLAAVLDAGPGAVVSHRSAAILLRIAHRDAPRVIEITVPRPRSSRMPGVIVHRSLD